MDRVGGCSAKRLVTRRLARRQAGQVMNYFGEHREFAALRPHSVAFGIDYIRAFSGDDYPTTRLQLAVYAVELDPPFVILAGADRISDGCLRQRSDLRSDLLQQG